MTCRGGLTLPEASTVVLVDDIRTTGATLTEAWRALQAGGLIGPLRKSSEGSRGRRWVATLAVVDGDGGGPGGV